MTRRSFVPFVAAFAGCSRARPLRIAVLGAAVAHLHVYLSKALGAFEPEGLHVELEELSSTAKTMEAMLGGSVDIAASTYEQVLQAVAANRRVRSFFINSTRPSQVLVASPARPEILNVADLRGKTVGVTSLGSAAQNTLSLIILRHGLSLESVTPLGIGNAASAIAAVERGKVDAAMLISLTHEILRDRIPNIRALADLRTVEGMIDVFGVPDIAGSVLAAPAEWLAANGETATRFCRALASTGRWIHERPVEEIESKLPESLRTPGSEAALRSLRLAIPGLTKDGRMPPGAPEIVRDYVKRITDPSLQVDLASTYTEEFLASGATTPP